MANFVLEQFSAYLVNTQAIDKVHFYVVHRIVVPFIQGYTDTGEFGTVAKLLDSLKMNFIYYGAMTVGLVILTIYLVLNTSMTTLY